MISTQHKRTYITAPARPATASRGAGAPLAHWGLAGVLLLFAYEWLLSGLNKLLSAGFQSELAANLRQSTRNNPNHWYASAVSRMVLPHASAVAILVEAGELLVAAGLAAGALLWLTEHRLSTQWASLFHLAAIAALTGSALMTANYYLMAGNTWPWLNPSNPFNEGLDIDGLLTLIGLALLVVQLSAWRVRRFPAR